MLFINKEERIINGTIKVRHWAADICSIFEDFLSNFDLQIPDANREGDEDEAYLYGDAYTSLEGFITDALMQLEDAVANGGEKPAKYIENFSNIVCEAFDSYFQMGVDSMKEEDEKPQCNHCALEDTVAEQANGFLNDIKEYPTYKFDIYAY